MKFTTEDKLMLIKKYKREGLSKHQIKKRLKNLTIKYINRKI